VTRSSSPAQGGVVSKAILLLVSCCLLLAACSGSADESARPAATAQRTASPPIMAPTVAVSATAASPLGSPNIAVFVQFANSINSGDVIAALTVFSDDVVWERGGQCPPGACIGKPAVQREITRDVMAHHKLTLVSAETSTTSPTVRLELRNDGTQRGNVERVIQYFAIEMKSDKISAVRVSFDLSDPVTAGFVASQSGTQPR
jgi:hypothetical protein